MILFSVGCACAIIQLIRKTSVTLFVLTICSGLSSLLACQSFFSLPGLRKLQIRKYKRTQIPSYVSSYHKLSCLLETGFFIGIGCCSIPFFLAFLATRTLPLLRLRLQCRLPGEVLLRILDVRKPSRRSVTAAKRKEKEKKERQKRIN